MASKSFVIHKSPRVFAVNGVVAKLEETTATDGYKQVRVTMDNGDEMLIPHPDNYEYRIEIAPGLELSARSTVKTNADSTKTKLYEFADSIDAFDSDDEASDL